MIQRKKYLIDTNSLITPYNNYYPFDFAPGFWEQMGKAIVSGSIVILDVVKDEIERGEDDLAKWLDGIRIADLKSIKEPDIIMWYSKILSYVQEMQCYKISALTEWSQIKIADPWLIATAAVYDYIIVTQEKGIPNLNASSPSKSAKIPDVAKNFNVKTQDLYITMRELGFKLL